ncbi:tetratricopeptide repeat protein [Streptomyces sp. R11]|uniref:Tetratricopeptide repeat protein n=1 Tax=Streptomyces sp. R11 TaxID=3238625 RepID=A0AB39NDF7_9ACTN
MQELIGRRSRAGFVGRGAERAAFRANLDIPPEDERHRFLFHVHGNAGVGKSFLLRELEQVARERGALTAFVDDNAGSVPESLEAMSRQFAAQGRRLKDLDRLLAAHRERRHEAELAAITAPPSEPPAPSAGSMAVARAGLVGLGMVPGVGAFAGAVDAAQLAQGADRLRSGLGARFRTHEDARLVLAPESVLTPVLLEELAQAASAVPWIVLFFDTYERTGRFLDAWLHAVMTSDLYGPLPATVVVVTAGQLPFDATRWGGFGDFMTDVPLLPFTEAETRDLLAGRGVVAEPVVGEVLRLTGGLPVLVSTLAESRPTDPADVRDPSATAVEWFLKRAEDAVQRSVALACALPRRLDADVFRAVVGASDSDAELDGLYAWLRGLPFVSERGGLVRYHDVVRAPMLRLQRQEAPRTWAARQQALAAVFREWRAEAEAGRDAEELWADEAWRELRLAELYHLLCAGERAALTSVLGDVVDACEQGESVAERWAWVLVEAGSDAETRAVSQWGRRLATALGSGGTPAALELVLRATGFERTPVPAGAGAAGTGYGMAAAAATGLGAGAAGRSGVGGYGWRGAGAVGRRRARASGLGAAASSLGAAGSVTGGAARGSLARRRSATADDTATTRPGSSAGAQSRGTQQPASQGQGAQPSRVEPSGQRSEGPQGQGAQPSGAESPGQRSEGPQAESQGQGAQPSGAESPGQRSEGPQAESQGQGAQPWQIEPPGQRTEGSQIEQQGQGVQPWQAEPPGQRAQPWQIEPPGQGAQSSQIEPPGQRTDRPSQAEPQDQRAQALPHSTTSPGTPWQAASADAGWRVALDPVVAARAYRARAIAQDLAGDRRAAVALLNRALELVPDDPRSLALRGEYHRVLGRHDEAISDLDRALELNPADAFALASRGATRLSREDLDEALADLDGAVRLKPDYSWALTRRARVHRAMGDPVRQLADLDRAVAVDPDWAWVRCERGDALRAAGRDEDALADYDHALAREPDYNSARASRGASLANLGRHEEALADLDRVLAANPSYAWAADQRAAVLRHLAAEPATPARSAGTDEARARHRDGQA